MPQHSSSSRQACTVVSQNGGLDPTPGLFPSGLCPGGTPGDGLASPRVPRDEQGAAGSPCPCVPQLPPKAQEQRFSLKPWCSDTTRSNAAQTAHIKILRGATRRVKSRG